MTGAFEAGLALYGALNAVFWAMVTAVAIRQGVKRRRVQ